ncbi:MAG: hypothetical protein AAF633_06870 [Chloroflexota bacterium]
MSKRGKRRVGRSKVGHARLRETRAKNQQRRVGRKGPPPRAVRHTPPPPPPRKPIGQGSRPTAELQSSLNMLELKVQSVQQRILLGSIQSDLNRINGAFVEIPAKLKELNRRGYLFTKDIEDALAVIENKWYEGQQSDIEQALRGSQAQLDASKNRLDQTIKQLNRPTQALVDRAESEISGIEDAIRSAEQSLRGRYQAIKTEVDEMYRDTAEAKEVLDYMRDSQIMMQGSESPILSAKAEWERDGGESGPDGVLYLTDQRLLFEQRERVATRKLLFITTKSEAVQKLLVDVNVQHIETIEHSEERRRTLQLGKDDILSLIMTGQADFSRLRFHIKNQEAADWADAIRFVQTGEIQEDRFDYDPEIEEEMPQFPANCPRCLAPVPPQPTGARATQCEFCGSTILAL